MKRIRIFYKRLLAATLAVLFVVPSFVFANSSDLGEISVYFNGEVMEFDQPPIIVNNRTMVPFRAIFEAFGANIEWNQEEQRVTATHTYLPRIVLNIGSERAFVDGEVYYLDAAPFLVPETSRTLVPIRFISEAFGAEVDWDNDARNVIINTGPIAPGTPQWDDSAGQAVGGGTALNPEDYEASGEWHPTHRNVIVGNYYFTRRGWRMSVTSYREMIAERDRIAREIFTPGMTEFDVVRAAHNWLVSNVSYNTNVWSRERMQATGSGWNPNWRPARYPREHQMAWSAFMHRTTVCAGYADALIYLLEPFNIQAMYINGPLLDGGTSLGSHAWNLVRVGGRWYHIDATWNRFYSGGHHMVIYTWFLLSDDAVRSTGSTTRSWTVSQFPAAPESFAWNRPRLIWDHGLNRWRPRTPQDDVRHNITLVASPQAGGGVTSNPRNSSQQGQFVTVTANANSGYEFDRWEIVSGGVRIHSQSANWATFMMPANNVSLRAHFRPVQQGHTVTISTSNFQAGTANASPHTNVSQGDWVTLQAHPNPGFEFDRWEIVSGTVTVQNINQASTGFRMPAGNVSIRAMFRQAQGESVSVIIDNVEHGTFSVNPNDNVAPGAWVSLQANPATGFEFDRWEVVTGTVQIQNINAASTGFAMPQTGVSVRAVFRPIAAQTFTLIVTAENAAQGTAHATPSANFAAGDTVTLTAQANTGYAFSHWDVTSGNVSFNMTSSSVTFQMPASNIAVRAVFEPTAAPQTFSVSTSVNNPAAGTATSPSIAVAGDTVVLEAHANPGFEFVQWTSGDVIISNFNSTSTTFIMPAGNVTVTAVFEEE